MGDPLTISLFNIIYEVLSAYGTVEISVGIPTDAYSFSGVWYAGSKLVLCLVMLRCRHRGLPVALDHVVRLPGGHPHLDFSYRSTSNTNIAHLTPSFQATVE